MGKSIDSEMEINWGIVFEENLQIVPIRTDLSSAGITSIWKVDIMFRTNT